MTENKVGRHIYDYIVVGAGISGLQSLQILTKKTKNVLALESQSFQAGRIISETLSSLPGTDSIPWIKKNKEKFSNVYIEKGATWIEDRHTYLLQICNQLGIQLREQHSSGHNLYLWNGVSMTVEQLKKHPKFGEELRNFLDRIDHLSEVYNKYVLTSGKDKVRSARMLIDFDTKLVSQFLQENCLTEQVRDLLQNFLQHTECVSCNLNSMHEVLTKNARSNDVGILRQFLGYYKEEQHQPSFLINNGTYELITKFTEQVQKNMGKSHDKFIKYDERVFGIDNRNEICIITTMDTKTNKPKFYRCRKILLSVPLAVSRTITFTNISKAKRFILDNQLRTNCVKSFLFLKKPFWRKFASGDAIFSSEHLFNMCHDISPPDQACGIMVFFHSGRKYDEWESRFMDEENQHEAKRKYLIKTVGQLFRATEQQKKLYLEDAFYYNSSFMNNENIRSGFQSCTSPGTFSAITKYGQNIEAFYRDENNVYFIGSEYSDQFASYIEGAIRVARKKCYKLIGEVDPLLQGAEYIAGKSIAVLQPKAKL